jgi:CRISPR-associated protein Cas5d
MRSGGDRPVLYVEEERQQRAAMVLRSVAYVIDAALDIISGEDNPGKHLDQFNRRARGGLCHHQPYLGCREFAAAFRLIDPNEPPAALPEELAGTRDLGWMLYDLDYTDQANPQPLFFRAKLEDGVMTVPDRNNREEVRG